MARSGGSVASPTVLNATWKRLLALLAGALGARAILRRRTRSAPATSPADELKAKLAATKEPDLESEIVAEPETEPEPEPEPTSAPVGVDERRADTHARARQAIEELRGQGE